MVLLALALIGPSIAGDLLVVLEQAGLEGAAAPVAFASLACFYGAWFGAMQVLRRIWRAETQGTRMR